jgi:hypothetical protein
MDNHSNSNSNSNSNIDKKDKKERAHHSLPAKYAKFIHFGYFLMNKLNPPNDQDEHDDHDEHDDDADNHDSIQQDKLDTNFKHFLNTLRIFDSVSNQIALVQEFFDSENTVEKDIHNLIIAHKNAINLALQSTTSSPDIFAMPKLSFFRNRTGKIDVSISAAGQGTYGSLRPPEAAKVEPLRGSIPATPPFSSQSTLQSSKQGTVGSLRPPEAAKVEHPWGSIPAPPSLTNTPFSSQSSKQSSNPIPSFTSHSSNPIPSKQDTFSTQSASQSFNPADIQAQIQAHIQAQIQAHIQAQIQAHIQAHIDSFNQKLADNISLHNSIQSQYISNNSNHESIKTAELSSKHHFVPIKIKKINNNLQQQQHTSSNLHQDIHQSIPHDSIHACIFLFNNTKYLIDDTHNVYDFFNHTHIGHLHNHTIFLL